MAGIIACGWEQPPEFPACTPHAAITTRRVPLSRDPPLHFLPLFAESFLTARAAANWSAISKLPAPQQRACSETLTSSTPTTRPLSSVPRPSTFLSPRASAFLPPPRRLPRHEHLARPHSISTPDYHHPGAHSLRCHWPSIPNHASFLGPPGAAEAVLALSDPLPSTYGQSSFRRHHAE